MINICHRSVWLRCTANYLKESNAELYESQRIIIYYGRTINLHWNNDKIRSGFGTNQLICNEFIYLGIRMFGVNVIFTNRVYLNKVKQAMFIYRNQLVLSVLK